MPKVQQKPRHSVTCVENIKKSALECGCIEPEMSKLYLVYIGSYDFSCKCKLLKSHAASRLYFTYSLNKCHMFDFI